MALVNQLKQLDANYPGGLQKYVTNAKRLLEDSKSGREPPLHGQCINPTYNCLISSVPQHPGASLSVSISGLIACREERLRGLCPISAGGREAGLWQQGVQGV